MPASSDFDHLLQQDSLISQPILPEDKLSSARDIMGSSELWRHSYSLPNIVHIYRQISIQVSGFILILTHYGYHKFYWSQILTDKKWVGPLEILCMIMFDISKMVPKRFFLSNKISTAILWHLLIVVWQYLDYGDSCWFRNCLIVWWH